MISFAKRINWKYTLEYICRCILGISLLFFYQFLIINYVLLPRIDNKYGYPTQRLCNLDIKSEPYSCNYIDVSSPDTCPYLCDSNTLFCKLIDKFPSDTNISRCCYSQEDPVACIIKQGTCYSVTEVQAFSSFHNKSLQYYPIIEPKIKPGMNKWASMNDTGFYKTAFTCYFNFRGQQLKDAEAFVEDYDNVHDYYNVQHINKLGIILAVLCFVFIFVIIFAVILCMPYDDVVYIKPTVINQLKSLSYDTNSQSDSDLYSSYYSV